MTDTSHDPVTLDIIQNALEAISDEMFAAMRKTAMSAIIYEVLDMGTGICDAEGQIASSGAGIPAFIGVLDKSVTALIAKFPPEKIRPGDVFATNDPYWGGVTHLNDCIIAMPVFAEGEIVAWTANIAHWNDVGGAVPGSMSADSTEIYQEGLRLPAVKIINEGVPNEAVMDIMTANSRLPDYLKGDMWSAISAARIGEKRLLDLVAKYGKSTFQSAMKHFMDYGERVTKAAIAGLPKGRFECAEEQDDGSVYHVAIEITDDAFIVDLTNNPDQVHGSKNASYDGVVIAAQMALKAVIDGDVPANGGAFRPLHVITRPGSVFHALEPAAVGYYFEVEVRVFDLMLRCLAPHLPKVLPAGSFASICGTVIGGPHPDTGRHYTIVEPQLGGWGAWSGRDGNAAVFSPFHGETFNCPAEVAEARYGLDVDRLSLNVTEGGEGEWRGGSGIAIDYRVRADRNFMTVGYTRARIKPWGLDGGADGSENYVEVKRTSGAIERYALATNVRLDTGDVVRVRTGTGGGYGDPAKRDRAAIADDIKNGYVSAERAAEIYGYKAEAAE